VAVVEESPVFSVQLNTPDYLDAGSADYIIMHDGIGSDPAMSITLSGAGVIAGNTYSISVILDPADIGTGNVQETVATATGTFAGASPQTIDISSLNVPTVYTTKSVHSSDSQFPPGLSATVTTPVESLSSTVTTFSYELAGADTFHLVYGPTVAFSGTTSATTASVGETISATYTGVSGVSLSTGITGSDLHYELEVTKDSDGTAAGTNTNNNPLPYGNTSVSGLTLSNLSVAETITARAILRTGTTASPGDTSVVINEQQYTIV